MLYIYVQVFIALHWCLDSVGYSTHVYKILEVLCMHIVLEYGVGYFITCL
jgi:hypothetical protein